MKPNVTMIFSVVLALSLLLSFGQASANVQEVEFWHTLTGVNGQAIEQAVANFNATVGKEKGIEVKAVFQGNDNMEKLKTLAQARDFRNFPDVAQLVAANIASVSEYDLMVPVQDMYDKGLGTFPLEDLEENMLRAYIYQGRQVGMPVTCSTILLYYNKDMFREVGLDPALPPQTIAEMADAISKLMVTSGNRVERYGLNVAVRLYHLSNFIGSQGEYNFFGNNEGGRTGLMTQVTFGEDGTLRNFLQEWESVIKTGGYKPIEDDINEEFALEMFGMAIMSTARIGRISSLVEDRFEWGVAPLPRVSETDTGGAGVGGSSLVMFDPQGDEERVKATWEFVQYMASPEATFELHKATGYIPVNTKVYDLEGAEEWFENQPAYKVAINQIHNSHKYVQEPMIVINWDIDDIIRTNMVAFGQGRQTLDVTHDNIVNESNRALEAYARANR